MDVESIEVQVAGRFGARGEPAENITYRASVKAQESEREVLDLMGYTDCCGDTQYAEARYAGGTHRMPSHPDEAESMSSFEQVSGTVNRASISE